MSEKLRNEVWHDFHDASRLCRYYENLSAKYRKRHRRVLTGLAVSAVLSAFASPLALHIFPDHAHYPSIALSFITGALAIVSLILGDADKSAVLTTVYTECSALRYKYRVLWLQVEDDLISDDEILKSLETLSLERDTVTSKADFAGIPLDDKINQNALEKSDEVLKAQYLDN